MEFKAKIWKAGNAHVITVPQFLLKNKHVDESNEIIVKLEQVANDGTNSS